MVHSLSHSFRWLIPSFSWNPQHHPSSLLVTYTLKTIHAMCVLTQSVTHLTNYRWTALDCSDPSTWALFIMLSCLFSRTLFLQFSLLFPTSTFWSLVDFCHHCNSIISPALKNKQKQRTKKRLWLLLPLTATSSFSGQSEELSVLTVSSSSSLFPLNPFQSSSHPTPPPQLFLSKLSKIYKSLI